MTDQAHEVYVEFKPVGRYVKVSAICAKTGFEVSIVGDPQAGQQELKRLAVRKLYHVMEKSKKKGHNPGRRPGLMT